MRAAGFVLLLVGGIAAGLPGSPVRTWIGSIGRDAAPSAPTAETAASADGSSQRSEAGVRLAPTGDSAHVSLVGAAPGTRVRVHLIEGDVLEVSAAAGTRFRTGAARVEVLDAASAVTVRVPRELGRAVVEADGRTLVRKRDDETTLPTLQAETVDGGIVFTLPAAADPRSP